MPDLSETDLSGADLSGADFADPVRVLPAGRVPPALPAPDFAALLAIVPANRQY
ncbi:MAG: pentapeptide repeat-containing protein [Spirochaetaceae bacterium]|nr:pentapeptide repeat-containing protein [Spirochaetaceae bacterium]